MGPYICCIFVFHGNHKVHSACKAFTHFPFAFLSWLNKVLVVVSFCLIGRSAVGNHYFRIDLYAISFFYCFDFGDRKDIWETATTFERLQVLLRDRNYFWETATTFERPQLLLRDRNYFWETATTFERPQLLLRDRNYFWETATTFERPQLLHLNTEIVIKQGYSAFGRWLCREVLLYFERPFENWVLQNALKKHHMQ